MVTSERRGYKLLGLRGHKNGGNGTDGTVAVKRRGGTHKKSNIEKSVDGVSRARTLMFNDIPTHSIQEVEEPEETGLDSQSEDSNEYDTELALMEQVPMIPTYGHFGMKTHFETKPVFTQMFGKSTSPQIYFSSRFQLEEPKWTIYSTEWLMILYQ